MSEVISPFKQHLVDASWRVAAWPDWKLEDCLSRKKPGHIYHTLYFREGNIMAERSLTIEEFASFVEKGYADTVCFTDVVEDDDGIRYIGKTTLKRWVEKNAR